MNTSRASISQKRIRLWQLLLPPLFAVVTLIIVAGLLLADQDPPDAKQTVSPSIPAVTGIRVSAPAQLPPLRVHGSVTPRYRLALSAEVSGKVVRLNRKFVVGGQVKAGELLVELDDSAYGCELAALQADLVSAELELQQEEERGRLAARDWQEFGQGNGSSLVLRKPQWEAARAAVVKARAAVDKVTLERQKTVLRAPFDALVVSTSVAPGSVVTAGTVVAELFSTARAEIRLPLSPRQASLVLPPDPAGREAVTISWNQGSSVLQRQGVLVSGDGFFDLDTRFTHVVVEVPDPYAQHGDQVALPLGRYVEVALPMAPVADAVELPESTLVDEEHVLRVNSRQELEFVAVTLVWRGTDSIVVTGDLHPGDMVVKVPPAYPVAGMKVQVVTGEQEPGHD